MITCEHCNEEMFPSGQSFTTLVGISYGECGRPHDDNCKGEQYRCKNYHTRYVHIRATCPCGWKGKLTCFCHKGEKVEL